MNKKRLNNALKVANKVSTYSNKRQEMTDILYFLTYCELLCHKNEQNEAKEKCQSLLKHLIS